MHLTSRALRRAALTGASLMVASATLGLAAPGANAAFTLGECGATSPAQFKAQGSSFQTVAQGYWSTLFSTSAGCNGTTPNPGYTANGSGNGNAAMGTSGGNATLACAVASTCSVPLAAGTRDPSTRFAGTDEPPNATQIAAANAGPSSGTADDGVLHTIPAALGAATVVVHLPDGCNLSGVTNTTAGSAGDTSADQRIQISNDLLEKAFARDSSVKTWGDLVPGITGCNTADIVRVVRTGSSGTTLSFKTFLDKINPSRGWLTTYGGGATTWPRGDGDASTAQPATVATSAGYTGGAPFLAGPATDSGGNLAKIVQNTKGSIGYVALSDARANSFEVSGAGDTTYWVPLQDLRSSGATYHEPTTDPTAHKPGVGTKGSACASAPLTGVPTGSDPTLGDWSKVQAIDAYDGYPACVVTYDLAWDDNAPVYGNTSGEEQNARAIKDYLGKVVVASAGQLLTNTDYAPLPSTVRTIAQNGVAAIGWNKSAAATGTTTTTTATPAATAPATTAPAVVPAVITKPSNAFSLTSSKATSSGLTFKVQLPGAGRIAAVATAKSGKKTIKVGNVTATASSAGTVTLTIKLSSAAKSAIKKAKSRKLSVTTVVSFLPTGGSAASKSKKLTVKAAKSTKKK